MVGTGELSGSPPCGPDKSDASIDVSGPGHTLSRTSDPRPIRSNEPAGRPTGLGHRGLALTQALRLPTFEVEGRTLLKRLTLVLRAGRVEHVFYPLFPPDRHADEVLAWLRANPPRR